MRIQAVILAAGKGKRMYSAIPKVLHKLAGKSMLEHVIETAQRVAAQTNPIVIFGHQGDMLVNACSHHKVQWVEQKEQLGTGHALAQALPMIADNTRVLVLYGDVPLIAEQTLKALIDTTPENAIGMLTANIPQPAGYGRIKRNAAKQVVGIVEEKDASAEEKMISEVNSGIYLIPAKYLKIWLPKLKNHNAQQEYYLTDVITLANQENIPVHTVSPTHIEEIFGVNDRLQLAGLERFYQRQVAESLLRQGVTLLDPARVDVRGEINIGRDVIIDVNVILEGRVVIGDECVIGPNTILSNVEIGKKVQIKANSVVEGAIIADECVIGPFARIRPETQLKEKVHIGNFVELKKTVVGQASKINHLSYVGDSEVGKQVNIGAGTITCNYDGVAKHKTIIGDAAFIGSCSQLVAPVTVGEGATIGAGSTITKDAPAHQLTLARVEQVTIPNWKRPQKLKA